MQLLASTLKKVYISPCSKLSIAFAKLVMSAFAENTYISCGISGVWSSYTGYQSTYDVLHNKSFTMISEIKNSDFSMLNSLELDTLLTPGRRNGVYSMLEKIKEYANSYT